MGNRNLKFIVSLLFVMAVSCNIPDTMITNIVHKDGSVTRVIEMKNTRNKFDYSIVQVPYDTTWNIYDTLEINSGGDTTWIKRAEKLFKCTEEIDGDYLADSSANKNVSRRTEFSKRFRWFNTKYKYAEIIDKELQNGYPVEEFLDETELAWFHSPSFVNEKKLNGPDSLIYRAFRDTVEKKVENWSVKNIISIWIDAFGILAEKRPESDITVESMQSREDDFTELIMNDIENFDSLWANGSLLGKFIGKENANEFKNEADSALNIAIEKVLIEFSSYSTRIIMPGKLTATNGYKDSAGVVLWPVKSDYFLTETYEMWAESNMSNIWAWIVSGLFILLLVGGLVFAKR